MKIFKLISLLENNSNLPTLDTIPNFSSPQSLYDWTTENIEYGWLDKDLKIHNEFDDVWWNNVVLHSPTITYEYKIGTCYEQSIFVFNVMLRDMPHLKPELWHIQMYNKNDNENVSNHACVSFNENDKYFWIETAWIKIRNIYGPFDTFDELKNEVEKQSKEQHADEETKLGFIWNQVNPEDVIGKTFNGEEFYDLIKYDWTFK